MTNVIIIKFLKCLFIYLFIYLFGLNSLLHHNTVFTLIFYHEKTGKIYLGSFSQHYLSSMSILTSCLPSSSYKRQAFHRPPYVRTYFIVVHKFTSHYLEDERWRDGEWRGWRGWRDGGMEGWRGRRI